MKIVSYLFAAVVAVALAACSNDPSSPNAAVGGEALAVARFGALGAYQSNAAADTGQRRVIADASGWTSFWGSLAPDPAASAGGPPSVDFAQNMVIAAVMPLRPSGGFKVTIEKVTEFSDHLEASVVSYGPGPDCASTAVLTRPFDVVQVAKRNKPVTFVERSLTGSCNTSLRTDTLNVGFNKTVDARGVKVTLVKVLGDSRCPMNAVCIWQGDAAVQLRFDVAGKAADVTLHTASQAGVVSTTINGAEFQLVGLTPYPVAGGAPTADAAYTAILTVR